MKYLPASLFTQALPVSGCLLNVVKLISIDYSNDERKGKKAIKAKIFFF